MQLTFYDCWCLAEHGFLPGIEKLQAYFKLYAGGVAPVDRSGVIRFPVRMKTLFPLPVMRETKHCYEEVCNERAKELLTRAERLDTSLYVFWSGGIDSTCVLVSLLKYAGSAQRERIVVLLSEDSIAENPVFYRKFVRRWLRREAAGLFPYILGTKNLIVTGEHNDQLFGSDIIAWAIVRFGADVINAPYDSQMFLSFFAELMGGDLDSAQLYVRLFERLRELAPVELKTNFDQFWWINFTIKWQTVYMRMLAYTAERNIPLLSSAYLKSYYAPFYNTEAFQLWSMNNLRQRMKNGWNSYKWPAKEIIYEFTRDADYRDKKMKRGSLAFLVQAKRIPASFIDDKFAFHKELASEHFYEPDNDLV